MKKTIITFIAVTFMVGIVAAQDNKVKVVRKNTELITRSNADKHSDVKQNDAKSMAEKFTIRKAESCKVTKEKKGKILPGKCMKVKNVKRLPVEPQKMRDIKKRNN